MNFWSAVRLVAQREILATVRGKGFWITFAVFVVALFAAAIIPGLFDDDSAPTVATVGPDAARVATAAELETRPVDTLAQAQTLVRDGEVEAAVVGDPTAPTGVRVVALTEAPLKVLTALAQPPPVDLLTPGAVDDQVVYLVSFAFAFVFFIFAMSGIAIAQCVVTV